MPLPCAAISSTEVGVVMHYGRITVSERLGDDSIMWTERSGTPNI